MSARFVPARVPLLDPRTGLISREWYIFFQNLMDPGGLSGDDEAMLAPLDLGADYADAISRQINEVISTMPVAAPVRVQPDDLTPPVSPPLFVSLDDVLPVFSALRDEIAILRGQIDDLKKGGSVL